MIRVFVLALVLLCAGCKKGPSWKTETYTEVNVKPQSGEVKIPASLWEKILALVPPAKPVVGEKAKSEKGESKEESPTPETSQEPLKVYLVERNKGVLKGQNIALSFVAGGGEINLSEYTANLRGSYYIAFEFMPDTEKVDTRVFFVSNSVVRKVGGDTLGSGCDTYFDLTKRVASAMKTDGFLVNTSDQRDLSALAGTYVFAAVIDGKLHLSTLLIKDDDHRALQCRH